MHFFDRQRLNLLVALNSTQILVESFVGADHSKSFEKAVDAGTSIHFHDRKALPAFSVEQM